MMQVFDSSQFFQAVPSEGWIDWICEQEKTSEW